MREPHPQALAFGAAAVAAGHVGRGPGFVDEHEPLGIEVELAVEPVVPLPQDVGAVLLERHGQSFFARHAVTNEEAVKPGHRDVQAEFDQRQAQFFKRDVLARLPHGEDLRSPFLDPPRAHVATLRLGAQSCRSRAAAQASGSPSRARRRTGSLPHGNSSRLRSPPQAAGANPSIEVGPSMPASCTSTDSESEITPGGNPSTIHFGRKPL